MSDRRAEQQAILTRAATLEAERQAAHAAKDWPKVAGIEGELRELWRAYADLERAA